MPLPCSVVRGLRRPKCGSSTNNQIGGSHKVLGAARPLKITSIRETKRSRHHNAGKSGRTPSRSRGLFSSFVDAKIVRAGTSVRRSLRV
jgi:hypothetical protein